MEYVDELQKQNKDLQEQVKTLKDMVWLRDQQISGLKNELAKTKESSDRKDKINKIVAKKLEKRISEIVSHLNNSQSRQQVLQHQSERMTSSASVSTPSEMEMEID